MWQGLETDLQQQIWYWLAPSSITSFPICRMKSNRLQDFEEKTMLATSYEEAFKTHVSRRENIIHTNVLAYTTPQTTFRVLKRAARMAECNRTYGVDAATQVMPLWSRKPSAYTLYINCKVTLAENILTKSILLNLSCDNHGRKKKTTSVSFVLKPWKIGWYFVHTLYEKGVEEIKNVAVPR